MEPIDVVIAGGGAVGSATAYFLASQPRLAGSVVVVEPDPTYEFAASARSAASIRQQFSTPLNIELSGFGMEFLRRGMDGAMDVGLKESTYLYLASAAGTVSLEQNVATQRRCGVPTELHGPADLARRYPWLHTADLAAGADTPGGEGWFDGYGLLRALRSASAQRGVRYVRDRVLAVQLDAAHAVRGVRLEGAGMVDCRWLVNAAGTHARAIAATADIDVPVVARKRNVFVFECAHPPTHCPMVIDPSGLWFRPEGERFICGVVPAEDRDVDPDDFDVDHHLFEELAWPALAHRVPAFESLRVTGAWAGHYDYNLFDQNAFLGECAAVPRLLLACGFSGHGLQHAPAIGRALAEFIHYGRYVNIDVGPFSYERYLQDRPIPERNII